MQTGHARSADPVGGAPCLVTRLIRLGWSRCCRGASTAARARARASWNSVSYLAGERWSDHPACTRPLLAAVARDVNDYTSDAGRARLAELIPSVIGLAGDDLHLDARIALRCARMALPVVAAERQRVMAVSVLVCERVLAGLDGRPAGRLAGW